MGQTIEIEAPDGVAEAYLTGATGNRGVLLYMDAIGLRPQIEDMADRIASWGYVVLAPNVFYRDGRAADLAPTTDLRRPEERERFFEGSVGDRVAAHDRARTQVDAPAWIEALEQRAGDGPIGITGYCMGARLAVWTAGAYPGTVGAVGGFHGGRLATDAPDSPHRSIAGSTAEYVFGHAEQDPGMTLEHVALLEEALQAAGRPHVNEVYAGAEHGFTMADTSAYDESAAERHFAELRTLLDRTL